MQGMRLFALALLLVAGCAAPSKPLHTYEQLQAIQPGVTTREEILKMFGEPRSIDISNRKDIREETFQYYRTAYNYWDYSTTELLMISMTNGVVERFSKSR